ncbi:jg1165 [Pararge aegeria aegeria]|uniref:Jg1165 protein n=1 Tax=Pararge aegeria aegeria TaxID=348720 RepID=A0A8S4QYJ0_9NEOP|nr:jg1165 [Pararge aegeria aegeria]
MMKNSVYIFVLILLIVKTKQQERRLGKFQEVFAWQQLTYNIDGIHLLQDRFSEDIEDARSKRQADRLIFIDDVPSDNQTWNEGSNNNQFWQTTQSPPANPNGKSYLCDVA